MAARTQARRVAICQPYVILGGRLQVIIGLVRALNRMGIEPDLLTLGTAFQPQQIEQNYGQKLRLHFRPLRQQFPWKRIPQDYQILVFNSLLKSYGKTYDLLIDSGNSQIYLPEKPQILSYVHFPREYRIMADVADINLPELRLPAFSGANLSRKFLQLVYRLTRTQPRHQIVCNSKFTRGALAEIYPALPGDAPVIYPPVNLAQYRCDSRQRDKAVVSLGRFAPDKGQLEQIKLAERLPEITFHFMGFVNKPDYFEQCQNYVNSRELRNVQLYPNVAFDKMIAVMKSVKYFLHTLVNEPFGLTAVQAIAAGCLPIVHDSGGQRETVPFAELRYHDREEIPQILNRLEALSQSDIDHRVAQLQQNAADNYDEPVFDQKITALLKEELRLV